MLGRAVAQAPPQVLQVHTRLLQASRTQPSSQGTSLQAGVWQLLHWFERQPSPGAVQVPHEPQLLADVPHVRPVQSGAQAVQTLPTQVVPAPHVPQLMVPPQPLGAVPHVCVPHAVALSSGVQQAPAVHDCPAPHAPQLPQLLAEVPHARPVQSGTQAVQTFAEQVVPAPHVPQLMVPPQPFGTLPQFLLPHAVALSRGVQHRLPTQLCPAGQVPHETEPQPLFTVPHCLPLQAAGFSLQPPQLPPPHVPQLTVLPQPSEMTPQLVPVLAHVRRGVSHALQVWEMASHFWLPAQVPQSSVLPQPSSMLPQVAPASVQLRGLHDLQAWVSGSHVSPTLQVPQRMVVQTSLPKTPQVAPKSAQVTFFVRQVNEVSSQVFPLVQAPQARNPPQPSEGNPQVAPRSPHFFGTQMQPPAAGLHLCCRGQSASFGVVLQPVGSAQLSTVHAMPSSLHAKLSAARQPETPSAPAPGAQISLPSQARPSEQAPSLGVFLQLSVTSSQLSTVHVAPSLHGAVPGLHPLAGSHDSLPLQNLPSSHASAAPGTQNFFAPQVSTPLQALPSSHCAFVVQALPSAQPTSLMQNFPGAHFVGSAVSMQAPVVSSQAATKQAVPGVPQTTGAPS
jgi:hypothetical protein